MHQSLLLTSAALAHLAVAVPHQHQRHGRLHAEREVVYDVETAIEYATVTEYVTAWGGPHGYGQSSSTTETTPSTSAVETPTTSSAYVPSPSTTEIAATTPATESSSVYVAPSSSTSAYVAPSSTSEAAEAYAPPSSSYSASTTVASSSSSSSSSAAPSSSASASSSGITKSNLTPNGKKAGLSGYVGIQQMSAFSALAPYISWYSDYTANTPTTEGVKGVGMLWGASGSPCGGFMSERLSTFTSLVSSTTPDIMFGFYEPDCDCSMSAQMSTTAAAIQWDALIAPLAAKGTVLGSPSMCKQYDEDFLTPFSSAITTGWDVTSIHINKPNVSEAQKDVEYYVNKYKKPVWVSEFACVNDQSAQGWQPCTDQTQVNTFINDVVKYFEGNSDVVAYGPSNGEGLGTVWPLTTSDGSLTTSGQTYLNAIKGL